MYLDLHISIYIYVLYIYIYESLRHRLSKSLSFVKPLLG